LTNVKAAITQLTTDRASVGASQARLNSVSEQLVVSKENLAAASSRIQDVDVAEESTQFAKHNILVQSGTAMLAQANQLPQSVLRLLQ
jgi:flagellin